MKRPIGWVLAVFMLCGGITASKVQSASLPPAAAPAQEQKVSVVGALQELERSIAQLRQEIAKPLTPASQPVIDRHGASASSQIAQTWSTQYRTILTQVTFAELCVGEDAGPAILYSLVSFVDPTDNKSCQVLLNDMGALCAGQAGQRMCVVVFRAADRQLTEADIAAIVPLDWIRQHSLDQDQAAALPR